MLLFGCAVGLLVHLYLLDAYVLNYRDDLGVAILVYVFAVFTIVLGFQAPGFTHVSLDRITQVGLVLILSPADSALINGAASLTYPFFAQNKTKQPFAKTLAASLHNSGMFVLVIYAGGWLYMTAGGALPLSKFLVKDLVPCVVLLLSMQLLNDVFIRNKKAILHGRYFEPIDYAVHSVEGIGFLVALLAALIINNNDVVTSTLFVFFLIIVVFVTRSISKISLALVQRINQMTTLNSVARAVSSTTKLDRLYDTVYRECKKLLDFNEFYLGVVHQQESGLEFQYSAKKDAGLRTLSGQLSHDLIDWVIKRRASLFLRSYYSSAQQFRAALANGGHKSGSFMGIPIIFDNELLGVIAIQIDHDFAYRNSDYELLQVLSSQIGVAIKNANLYAELRGLNDELERRVQNRTAQLEAAQRSLIDQARRAGMAEVATSALHNIGNILNTVYITAQTVRNMIQNNKLLGLGKANKLLQENEHRLVEFLTEDGTGKKLLEYYRKYQDQVEIENKEQDELLERLMKGVDNVTSMVSAQQNYAELGMFSEKLELSVVIFEALALYQGELTKANIEVLKEYLDNPVVKLQRSKFVQVLINLFKNSIDAMQTNTNSEEKRITIRAWQSESHVNISVSDTGPGVSPDYVDKLFTQGFTSKKSTYGMGLHSCANYLKEMGGAIWLDRSMSAGACFVIQIPYDSEVPG